MNVRYPDEYPDEFEKKLESAGARQQTIERVYRILYYGNLDKASFEGTYLNKLHRGLRISKKSIDKIGSYSTSCYLEKTDIETVLKFTMKSPPAAKIAIGKIVESSGYSQVTKEREKDREDSHTDWWIFSTVDFAGEILANFSIEEGDEQDGQEK